LPFASVQVTASKTGVSIRLHKGQVMEVILPPDAKSPNQSTTYALSPAGSSVLSPIANAAGFFTGAGDGTVKIVVTQAPVCPSGSPCPAHVINVGSVTVTVWG
jgi:hypothetical protein